jgi:hypothetical protein
VTYVVVRNPGGKRVSTHPHLTLGSAQAEADELNISSLIKDFDQDPRPYEVRRAEAAAAYRARN